MKKPLCFCIVVALLIGLLPAVAAVSSPDPGNYGWYTAHSDFSGWDTREDGSVIAVSYDGSGAHRIWKPVLSDPRNFTLNLTVKVTAIRAYVEILGLRLELNPSGGNGNQVYTPDLGGWFDAEGQEVAVNLHRENGGNLQIRYEGKGNPIPVLLSKTPADGANTNLALGALDRGASAEFSGITVEEAACPAFYRKTLSLQSYIAFHFTVKNSALENYDSSYVIFERYDHIAGTLVSEKAEGVAYGSNYQLFEYKVSSYQMSDTLTATLYGRKDGICYKGESYIDSVESFVLSRMPEAAASNRRLARLYANLLTYGARAQSFLDYSTDNLADANLGEYASFVTTTAPSADNLYAETSKGLTGATKNKLALGISSAVQIQLRINLNAAYDVNTVYGELSYTRGTETITQRIDGKDFTKSGSRYVLIFDAITAVDGRAPVQITIYDQNGNAISETWTYSISSYLVDGGLSGNGLATMEALLNYFDSAAKVFG